MPRWFSMQMSLRRNTDTTPDSTPSRPDPRADQEACRAALRNGSKTFLAASMLLPRRVHEPACALYAFCRVADDAVDAPDHVDQRLGAVLRLRRRLDLAYAGTPMDHCADRALAVVVEKYGIPRALFDALLEGFEWDVGGRRYETLEDLHEYAARVAGTVGAMMALLMGVRSANGLARACDLGVAMQLSNIARDVGEDARMGRLYLPRAWLVEAGIDPDRWLERPAFTPALGMVVKRLLASADALYRRVDSGVACLPLSCRPGINAARFLYAEIGHEVERRGLDSVSGRARVSASRKLAVLLVALSRIAPAHIAPHSRESAAPLAATRFLVDAAAETSRAQFQSAAKPRKSLADRVVWTAELFARLEQRDRLGTPRSSSRSI
jgi:15-cis-phytoene synthase